MAHLQSTTISGSNSDTGSLQITGSTMVFPIIESSLTSSFSGSGKMWVNAETNNLQYAVDTALGTVQSPASFMGAWSAGSAIPAATRFGGSTGTQNAYLFIGGLSPSPTTTNATKEYNGASWSAGGNMINAARSRIGGGSQNAAVAATTGVPFGSATEEYDGSSWTAGGNTITAVGVPGGAGVQDALFIAGGYTPSKVTCTENYNGASWSSGPNMIVGLREGTIGGAGTVNAGLVISGISTGDAVCGCTDHYDGSAWSLGPQQNFARIIAGAAGTQNAVSYFGGSYDSECFPPSGYDTEEYNGISWVTGCGMLTQRSGVAGGNGTSSQNKALAVGGYDAPSGTVLTCVEAYDKDFIAPYTTCIWTSGASNALAKSGGKGAGDSEAALSFGGSISPARVACTEEYNGTNWSTVNSMINAVGNFGGTGTANAALAAGGEPATCCKAEEWNGTTWAAGNNLSQGGYGNATLGTQNSALNFGGNLTKGKKAETYDGTNWSTISDMNCCRRAAGGGAGTTNAAIVFGGRCYTAPTTCQLTLSEEWDGSSWSIGASYTTPVSDGVAGGHTVSTALAAGGYNPTSPTGVVATELYNGTSWSKGGSAASIIKQSAGHSIGSSAFAVGGNPQTAAAQFYSSVSSTTLCSSLPVWSGGHPLLAGADYGGGFGTQNSAVLATGRSPGTPTAYFGSQEYNGSAWSTGGTTNCQTGEGYGRSGAGTQNAGLLFGGWPAQTWTEKYDGSSWTTANAMITTAYGRGSAGTQNAALAAGKGPSPVSGATEEFDGTNWSSTSALSTARYSNLTTGTQNDAVTAGGGTPSPFVADTEEYNGSTWSTGGSLSIARKDEAGFQMFGEGSYNATYAGGRTPTKLTANEEYNGSVWSSRPELPLALSSVTRIGTSNAGLMAGGRTNASDYVKTVYNYDDVVNTCMSVWSVGADMIQARCMGGGSGTQNAGLAFGGNGPGGSACANTEKYDGTTWSATGTLITARMQGAAFGTQNASVYTGGLPGSACTEEFDGTSWSTATSLITARCYMPGAGTLNAGLVFGGIGGTSLTEKYDGTAWTATGTLNNARYGNAGGGTQNSALSAGGTTSGYNCTETFDGSNWTTQQLMPNPRYYFAGAGDDSESFTVFGGGKTASPNRINNTEEWNGYAWSNRTPLLRTVHAQAGAGNSNAALSFGGYFTGIQGRTEEYNCGVNQNIGAGEQSFIGKVNFVTE